MKKRRKLLIKIIITVFCICVFSITLIYSLPIDYDAGACSGGYASFILDKYENKFINIFLKNLTDLTSISSVKVIKGSQKAQWEYKTIFMEFDVQYHHAQQGDITQKVKFVGERTWFDTYNWMISTIDET